jgi:hypothetical protein
LGFAASAWLGRSALYWHLFWQILSFCFFDFFVAIIIVCDRFHKLDRSNRPVFQLIELQNDVHKLHDGKVGSIVNISFNLMPEVPEVKKELSSDLKLIKNCF